MKWILIVSSILVIAAACFVQASESESKILEIKCPVCKRPIVEGSFLAQQLIKGQAIPVHFECAYEDLVKKKWLQVVQQKEK